MCFSYGSGGAASMFAFESDGLPVHPSDALERLARRKPKTIPDALALITAFESTHGRFGFEPSWSSDRQDGAFYLGGVTAVGVREYARHESRGASLRVRRDDAATHIEMMRPLLDESFLADFMRALDANRLHIFVPCESSDAEPESSLELDLIRKVLVNDVRIATICAGATLGRAMLFPALSDVVIGTAESRFGFPGALPGAASAALARRVSSQLVRRWVLLREIFDARTAMLSSLIDGIAMQRSDAELELSLQLGRSSPRTELSPASPPRARDEPTASWARAGVLQLVLGPLPQTLVARSDLHVAIVYNFSPSPRLDVLRNLDAPLLEVASRAVTKLADWTACVLGAEAFGLAASTHDTAATAQQHALTLAFTIASAPQTGTRNTTRLLRLE